MSVPGNGTLRTQRTVVLLAAATVLGFHWLGGHAALEQPLVPFWERLALVTLYLIWWVATATWGWARQRHAGLFEVMVVITAAWVVRVAAATAADADRVMILIMIFFAFGLLFRRILHQVAFHLGMGAATAGLFFWQPPEALDPILVLVSFLVFAAVTTFASINRLRMLEELSQLSALARRVHNGVLIADGSGRVQWANEGFTRMSGLQPDEVQRRHLRELYADQDPQDQATLCALEEALVSSREVERLELAHRLPDGERRWVAVDLTWVHEDDKTRILAVETDITATRAYLAQVEAAHEQTQATLRGTEHRLRHLQRVEAMGRLAGGVAHDFNNLLAVILGYLTVARRHIPPEHPANRPLEEITGAARRAADLTRQLLAFTRQQVLAPAVIALDEVLDELQGLMEGVLGEQVTLLRKRSETELTVRADPGQLQQVVMNLVLNARDAQPEGGRILVETGLVILDPMQAKDAGLAPGPYACIAVTDEGMGMDPATRARIFEPFFTTKEVGKGTGLGLSTALGIVEQSGGTILFESAPGKGSTFRVLLPPSGAAAEDRPEPRPSKAVGGHETVLVVEDQPEVRNLVEEVLREAGYTVLLARDVRTARDCFARADGRVHLLLTDVVLPGGNGAALAAELRARKPELRVVLMSGYTRDALGDERAPPSDSLFLQKPFLPGQLLAQLRRALDGPPPSPPRSEPHPPP